MSPIRVVKISELRRPTRNKESVVEHLEEFHAAKLKLHSGLKPQEAIEISIPKSTERGRKHLRASFSVLVQPEPTTTYRFAGDCQVPANTCKPVQSWRDHGLS
jgi:hypothetical protein